MVCVAVYQAHGYAPQANVEEQESFMLTQIGGKIESDFTQPLGMLSDCHKRIRYFLNALLATVDHANRGSLTPPQRTSLEAALRYFRDAAPKHTADEEQSLFPRLRCMNTPEMRGTLEKIERLEADHRKAELQHQEADAIIHLWMTEGGISPEAHARLTDILTELSELYERHIALEETEVFPLAAVLLSDVEKNIVGREMAARRGITNNNSNFGSR